MNGLVDVRVTCIHLLKFKQVMLISACFLKQEAQLVVNLMVSEKIKKNYYE